MSSFSNSTLFSKSDCLFPGMIPSAVNAAMYSSSPGACGGMSGGSSAGTTATHGSFAAGNSSGIVDAGFPSGASSAIHAFDAFARQQPTASNWYNAANNPGLACKSVDKYYS